MNLEDLFYKVHNWKDWTTTTSQYQPVSNIVTVWEGLVSLSNRTVAVFYSVNHSEATRVMVTLVGQENELLLGEILPPFANEKKLPLPLAALSVVDSEMGLQQFPFNRVRIEAFDGNSCALGEAEGPLNVDCPGAFWNDYLCRPDGWRLDNQIYQAGLGTSAEYAAIRAHVDRALLHTGREKGPKPSHQADLDLFFRRLHVGFRGLLLQLEKAHGSLYRFRDTLHQLGQWAALAVKNDENREPYTAEQQFYLCDRIVRTVRECVEIMKRTRCSPKIIRSSLQDEFLGQAAPLREYARRIAADVDLRMAVRNLLSDLRALDRIAKGK